MNQVLELQVLVDSGAALNHLLLAVHAAAVEQAPVLLDERTVGRLLAALAVVAEAC